MPMTGEQLASHLSKLMTHDAYSVSNSDNPNTSLTQSLFDGTNYINWSRQFRLGLGTKDKLGFIDGGITKPEENTTDFAKWLRSDRLVGCWILSSMAPEIAQSFVYNTSAKDLWDEVQERYAQSNASLLYQLKMELMRVVQGGMTVTQYFNMLRKIWDDIQSLNGIPMCSCGNMAKCSCKILKRIQELEAQDRLLHFLINLSPEFDITKNQILSTIPMPSLNSAYQLVLQVESQKQITAHNARTGDPVAFLAGSQNTANIGAGVTNSGAAAHPRKDWKRAVNDRKLCSLCNMKGHLAESCFEVIGYPDWYKGKKGKRGNKMVAGAMADDTPIQVENISSSSKHTNLDPDFLNSIYQEVYKMIRGSAGQAYSGPTE